MTIALIVAAAQNNIIGSNNQLPWHLPADLKYFKAKTLNKPIIMGRKTFDSIGKPLPGRTNIVVTRQSNWIAPEGVLVVHNLEQAFELGRQVHLEREGALENEIMVIGGAEIYSASLPFAQRVYLTQIEREYAGDAYFPKLSSSQWRKVSSERGDPLGAIPHSFLVFERID